MDRVNKKMGNKYIEKIKKFKCDDTIQLYSDKNIIVKPSSTYNNRATYSLGCNNGIKNLQISGEWDYAELTCGGSIIEKIYPEIRNTFTSTLNGIPPTIYHERQLNIISKSLDKLFVSYDTIMDNDIYMYSTDQYNFQIYQCQKHTISVSGANNCDILHQSCKVRTETKFPCANLYNCINLYHYINLPATMIAVKIPYKCKKVFLTCSYFNPYDNMADIVPFIYDKEKDMWILNTINSMIDGDRGNFNLHIIAHVRGISNTSQESNIDLFVENINIGLQMSGMYGCKFAY